MKIEITVTKSNDLISILTENGFSYPLATALYKKNEILVNGKLLSDYNLKSGDIVSLDLNEEYSLCGDSKNDVKVLYEDEYLLAVYKQKNLATIPTIKHYDNNLGNDVTKYFKDHDIKSKIHVINRLDYETSGIVIFAKHQYIHNLMKNVKIDKYYKALVHGILTENGVINKPIFKVGNNKKRIISPLGKQSITEYSIIKNIDEMTEVYVHLLTGRSHQIRVHFSSINHPLAGDSLYGEDKNINLELECYEMNFIHPITHKQVKIKSHI